MLAWLILHTGIGAAGTWLARRYALQHDLVDLPGERRSHQSATPRGGGVSITAALLVAAIALAFRAPSQAATLAAFAGGVLLVAAVGWVDDHRPLSPWLRLAVHGVAAAVFAAALHYQTGNAWTSLLAFAAALVLTNVWNFMDGIDGIAATQALLVAIGLALFLDGAWALLALALAAACVGFLPFNFPRARIFMGDVGSGSIGFAIAALCGKAIDTQGITAAWLLLPLSAFLVDAGLTLLRRVLRREAWWTPHTQHAYQGWARRRGHVAVTSAYVGWTALGLLLMGVAPPASVILIVSICLAWYTSAGMAWWKLQRMEAGAQGTGLMVRKKSGE